MLNPARASVLRCVSAGPSAPWLHGSRAAGQNGMIRSARARGRPAGPEPDEPAPVAWVMRGSCRESGAPREEDGGVGDGEGRGGRGGVGIFAKVGVVLGRVLS